MFEETRRYIELAENDEKHNVLCVEVGYSLGGYNWYNGDSEPRGYYLYCTPCERKMNKLSDGREYASISQILGRGGKTLLKEVTRQSKKAKEEALKIAKEKENWLIQKVLNRYGLALKEEV